MSGRHDMRISEAEYARCAARISRWRTGVYVEPQRGMADAGMGSGLPGRAQPDAASRTLTSMDRSIATIERVVAQEQEHMRRAAKRDANEPDIIDALRAVGATVQAISAGGCPDLLVGYRGVNYAIEVKDGSLPPSGRLLTAQQKEWHRTWGGTCYVANSPADALAIIGLGPKAAA